mmetsp:Transcript_17797/g.56903  ORF Transcript_17797/g.56903 Transcript_17797/m.56903 type:complete len:429 (-) Transcript_17797:1237-2523(-)
MKAMAEGNMVSYFSLAQQYRTQDEPAYCGISTLVMVLNALEVDSGRIWKGPWRWYHETMLNCCTSLDQVKESGISMPEWLCLAQCNGTRVVEHLEGGGTLEEFRSLVRASARRPSNEQALVVSYSRKQFEQTGDGHYSPIGGYCEELDAVLILDVARFKYPAHWVRLEDMWKAMQRHDPDTGKPRGCVLLEPSALNSTIIFTIRTHFTGWDIFSRFLSRFGKSLSGGTAGAQGDSSGCCSGGVDGSCPESDCTCSSPGLDIEERILRCFFGCMPPEVSRALAMYDDSSFDYRNLSYNPRDHAIAMESLKEELQNLAIFAKVDACLRAIGREEQNVLISTVLFLAFPHPIIMCESDMQESTSAFERLQELGGASELLQDEIRTLHKQFILLTQISEPNPILCGPKPSASTKPIGTDQCCNSAGSCGSSR